MILQRIQEAMLARCELDPARPLLLGVSGGPDSLALLHALWQLGWQVAAAHLDHALRPESSAEAEAVRATAARLRVPFFVERADAARYARENGLSLEEAARTVRYRFLFRQAEAAGAQAVVVAHTADDQVETVLMHLLRGSGLDGLRGMPYRALPNAWSDTIPLARPLLGVWKSEVLEFISSKGLAPAFDPTNQDTTFYRNRLRHELVPYLETYNPRMKEAVLRMAETLSEDQAALEGLVDAAWRECVLEAGEGFVKLRPEALLALPLGVQRRLLRRAIGMLRPGLRDIGLDDVDRAIEFLHQSTRRGERDLAAGLRLLLEGGNLWLAAWEADLPSANWPQLTSNDTLSLPVPGALALPGGWVLEAYFNPDAQIALAAGEANADPYQAWLDAAALAATELSIRSPRPGDRFRPLGLRGHSVKLSDFFINVRLPRRARAAWPLVLSGDEIVWVPGLRLAHPFKLTPASSAALHLHLYRPGSGA